MADMYKEVGMKKVSLHGGSGDKGDKEDSS